MLRKPLLGRPIRRMAAEVHALDIIVGASLLRRWPGVVWAELLSNVSSAMTLSLVTSFWRLLNGLVSVDTVASVFLRTTPSAEVLSSRPGTATVRGFLPPRVVVSLSSNVSTCF